MPLTQCSCCGSHELEHTPILWPELIESWGLEPHEAEYIDRQQGYHCMVCGSNLRSMALADAVMMFFGFAGVFADFVKVWNQLRVLELNEAGQLNQFLRKMPRHVLASFPDVDMQDLPYEDVSFDLVVHSDTLEHVPDPVRGLAECRRVMASGGATCFTVPIVVGRLTRSRACLPPMHHGSEDSPIHLVQTEYGSDMWEQIFMAGFDECRIGCTEFPAGLAITASESGNHPKPGSLLGIES